MTDEENYILFLQSTTNTPFSSKKVLQAVPMSTDLAIIEEIDFNKFIKSDDLEFLKTAIYLASGNVRILNFNDSKTNFVIGKVLISYEKLPDDKIDTWIVYVLERQKSLKDAIFYRMFETEELAFKFFRVIFDIKDLYKKICTKCNGSGKYIGFTSIENCECINK